MAETRLEGTTVFAGNLVRLEVDTVALDDGARVVREVVRHPGAAVVVPELADGRLVLVRQYRYPVDQFLLELPAGKLGPGEEPLACARRELHEETGLVAGAWRPLGSFFAAPGFTDEHLHCFLARDLAPAPAPPGDPDEVIEVVALPRAEVLALARSGGIRDAKTLAGLLLASLS